MAKVKLHLLNIFQLRINKKFIEYEGKTVGDIISQFLKDYKDKLDGELLNNNKTKLNPQILILLNGRNIRYLKNFKTKLNDNDDLYLSFALAGG
ncbi:MAG: MoaD/ThiS family protein [Promethearchaeota archaeon]|jgi:molybdopterin converting factor small subunit